MPNELDWEVGKRSDPIEEPPCDGSAGFRVDIVLDVSGLFDPGGKYRLIEVKNVNQAGDVEGQLNCYLLKMGSGGDKLNVGRLGDLSDEQWALFWADERSGEVWYAWALLPGYVLFGREIRDAARIPQWVTDKADKAGRETISLPVAPLSPPCRSQFLRRCPSRSPDRCAPSPCPGNRFLRSGASRPTSPTTRATSPTGAGWP